MCASETYICDADCLINLHRHFAQTALKTLEFCIEKGHLKIPEGVVREVIRGTDKLAAFVEEYRCSVGVCVSGDERLKEEIAQLERRYGEKIRLGTQEHAGFWRSKAGQKAADAQVVAVAKMSEGGLVVSDDGAVKLACALEGVPCIGWSEFARRLELTQQLTFDFNSTGSANNDVHE